MGDAPLAGMSPPDTFLWAPATYAPATNTCPLKTHLPQTVVHTFLYVTSDANMENKII